MAFEKPGSLGECDLDRFGGRPGSREWTQPNWDPGVAVAEQADLVEIELVVRGGVKGHAMHQGEGRLACTEELHQPVDLIEVETAGGHNDWFVYSRDLFEQRASRWRSSSPP